MLSEMGTNSASKSPLSTKAQPSSFHRNLGIFLGLIAVGFVGLYLLFVSAPEIASDACKDVSLTSIIIKPLPTAFGGTGDVFKATREVWACAEAYRASHGGYVLTCFAAVYIVLQAFAIPGPIVLSILSGALYPSLYAQILVAACATIGATLCYLISSLLGKPIVTRLMPSMLDTFREKILHNSDKLLYYILFLRITPVVPNWFVNVSCPIVGVPLLQFVVGTFFGLMPANYFHVSTGAVIASMESLSISDNASKFATLFLLQFLALIPTLFKKKLQQLDDSGGVTANPKRNA